MILDGLKVIDLSRIMAGPLAAQYLADHGADVIKVEGPAQDDTRKWGPPFADDGTTGYYNALNRNKRNICLDLKSAEGQDVLAKLLADADVLIDNFKAGTLDKWGFAPDRIEQDFPRLIHCRITGYGIDGPLGGQPGYDAVMQAYGGLMSVTGEPDGSPVRLGMPAVDMVTALHSFSGILLALRERESTGRGQLLDSTLLDSAVSMLIPQASNWLYGGGTPHRTGAAHPTVAPYEVFACADGDLFIAGGNDGQFAKICRYLGVMELVDDPRFSSNGARSTNRAELKELLQPRVAAQPRADLLQALAAQGIPAAPVNTVPEMYEEPQVKHRKLFFEDESGFKGVRNPIVLSGQEAPTPTRPARTGQHSSQILAECGFDEEQIAALQNSGAVTAESELPAASAEQTEKSMS
ncbi:MULTISPECIES: CaiB/BaiF CoA transferase family protein [Brevibacterium]|uniref:Crotonobetainyl-CoA:carnitine CoA-transferase CaiB n=2 Tax=Brevibacterium TaxID=1696 RepID=A0A1H1PL88_BRESA|nr:CaiB/BaiF CoA-transferase family protein [Brevibacterium sandarakinum]SDS11998.1 Crotonobetainyl-CoA:carnitine CoA-transferase CaiB [Brevibacterium sandarakinum]